MNAPRDSAVLALLRGTRRRIWAGRVFSRLIRAAWGSAAILLCTGLIHALLYPIPWPHLTALASLPLGVAALQGLVCDRPTLQSAATTADRWFDGKALMSAALDQLFAPRQRHTRASRFVIEAAERTAPRWLARLRREHRWQAPRHAAIPLALALAGVYLLLLPGQAARQETTALVPASRPTHDTPLGDTSGDFIAGLQEALRTAGRETADPAPNTTGPEAGIQPRIDKADAAQSTDAATSTPIGTVLPADAARVPHVGNLPAPPAGRTTAATTPPEGRTSPTAGTQAGQRTATHGAIPAAPPLAVEFFTLPRSEGVKGGTPTRQGATLALGPMTTTPASGKLGQAVTAAGWDTDMPDALALTPGQRRYIQQYFSGPGETQ